MRLTDFIRAVVSRLSPSTARNWAEEDRKILAETLRRVNGQFAWEYMRQPVARKTGIVRGVVAAIKAHSHDSVEKHRKLA